MTNTVKLGWAPGWVLLLCLAACNNDTPRNQGSGNTPVQQASQTTEQPSADLGSGKSFALEQLKMANGDGFTIMENIDLMPSIAKNAPKDRIQMYGEQDPFKRVWQQTGTFNGVPIKITYYELADPAQAATIKKHMEADYEARWIKNIPENLRREFVQCGNCLVGIIPRNNKAFVRLVMQKLAEKAQ